jgi:outer membrane immunogenic protein
MRGMFGFVALGVGFANGALAADYPTWAAPVYQAPVAIAPSWTGFYLGFNAGWGWTGSGDTAIKFGGARDVIPFTQTKSSPLVGGQLAYNWQTGSWVWGIEGDVDGSQVQANHSVAPPLVGTAFLNEKQMWLASARFKAGFTWGPGLIYFTLGEAWSGVHFDGGATTFAGGSSTFAADKIRSGTVFGTGYEWMIAPNWAARTELLLYKFRGATTQTITLPGATVASGSTKFDTLVARIGLDYKFDWVGWGKSPVATRY